MSVSTTVQSVLGVGFGPASIAIAIAFLEERDRLKAAGKPLALEDICFVDQYERFSWHPGMLLPGARMQISFLKDLATMRSPSSSYTFLTYLHEQQRLAAFINRGSFTPTRREYSDYLTWAAEKVQHAGVKVHFGERVVRLEHSAGDDIVKVTSVTSSGDEIVRFAKHITIAPGGSPNLPPPLRALLPNPRVLHTSGYISGIDALLNNVAERPNQGEALKIAVVGSGQSAAEVLLDLQSRLESVSPPEGKSHRLDMIIRSGSLKPSDDSPFSNEIFDPESTDFMYDLPEHARHWVHMEYKNTNYSVVNARTLDALYEAMYAQKVEDRATQQLERRPPRIEMLVHHGVVGAGLVDPSTNVNGVQLLIQHTLTGALNHTEYDAVVLATGYERKSWLSLLSNSNFGREVFGIESPTSIGRSVVVSGHSDATSGSACTDSVSEASSGASTPSTSISSSLSSLPPKLNLEQHPPAAARHTISRAYRLLPIQNAPHFKPAVYLQGCTESTHGLSDTLLSVLGVRAGEVVQDLFAYAQSLKQA